MDGSFTSKMLRRMAAVFASMTIAVMTAGWMTEYGGTGRAVLTGLAISLAAGCVIAALIPLFKLGSAPDPDDISKVRVTAAVLAVLGGILLALLAPNQADKEYDYVVNGIKMSEGAENFAGRLAILGGAALLLYFLIAGIGRLFLRIKSLGRKEAGTAALCAAGIAVAIALGAVLGTSVRKTSKTEAVTGEEAFLGAPAAVKKGSVVEFGSYPQNGSTPEPIRWRVVEKKDGELTLLSVYVLEDVPYSDKKWAEMTYPDSRVRSFLKKTFPEKAFTEKERALLLPIPLGNGEEDPVSVPTYNQGRKWLGKDTSCLPTENVKKSDVIISDLGDCGFYLRPDDPDDTTFCYYSTSKHGTKHLILDSTQFTLTGKGVRPVIRLSFQGVDAGK